MTDTPRTDAATNLALTGSWVRAEHARVLERELSAANARVKDLERNQLLCLAALKSVRASPEASGRVNAVMFDALIASIERGMTASADDSEFAQMVQWAAFYGARLSSVRDGWIVRWTEDEKGREVQGRTYLDALRLAMATQ